MRSENGITLAGLSISLHRTVRVAEGRVPANLPPSLGRANIYYVADFKEKCPSSWDENGLLVPLHDTEALWLSFSSSRPRALLVGAGGVNAVTGEKLGTVLEAGNYLVAPPQPWLDGWKNEDGSVYQFVATPYKGGDGLSVAEQLIGKESLTGGIGIAVFEPKDSALAAAPSYSQGISSGAFVPPMYGGGATYGGATLMSSGTKGMVMRGGGGFSEMGVGKGGKIAQKIYPDPHGLEAWQETPAGTRVIYLVSAEAFEEIAGIVIPKPVVADKYQGAWFGLNDPSAADVPGSSKFHGLGSAFAGNTSNLQAASAEPETESKT